MRKRVSECIICKKSCWHKAEDNIILNQISMTINVTSKNVSTFITKLYDIKFYYNIYLHRVMARNLEFICLIIYCNDRFITFSRWETFIHLKAFGHIIKLKCNCFQCTKKLIKWFLSTAHHLIVSNWISRSCSFRKRHLQNIRLFWLVK